MDIPVCSWCGNDSNVGVVYKGETYHFCAKHPIKGDIETTVQKYDNQVSESDSELDFLLSIPEEKFVTEEDWDALAELINRVIEE